MSACVPVLVHHIYLPLALRFRNLYEDLNNEITSIYLIVCEQYSRPVEFRSPEFLSLTRLIPLALSQTEDTFLTTAVTIVCNVDVWQKTVLVDKQHRWQRQVDKRTCETYRNQFS